MDDYQNLVDTMQEKFQGLKEQKEELDSELEKLRIDAKEHETEKEEMAKELDVKLAASAAALNAVIDDKNKEIEQANVSFFGKDGRLIQSSFSRVSGSPKSN